MTAFIQVWTDGSSDGRSGNPGGWAALFRYEPRPDSEEERTVERAVSGWAASATNQRMELAACVMALNILTHPSQVIVYCDSAYVVNGMRRGWIPGWEKNGWRNAQGDPVSSRDLWEALGAAAARHLQVRWMKVKGHSTSQNNERADRLAKDARGYALAQSSTILRAAPSGLVFDGSGYLEAEVGTELWFKARAKERAFERNTGAGDAGD